MSVRRYCRICQKETLHDEKKIDACTLAPINDAIDWFGSFIVGDVETAYICQCCGKMKRIS